MISRALPAIILACSIAAPLAAIEDTSQVEGTAPGPTTPEADDPIRLRELIDTLDQSSLQESFRLLTKDYINHEQLDPLAINRAALQGMLSRLDFGAMLLTEKQKSERNSPFRFHDTLLTPRIAYIRFGTFKKGDVGALDKALKSFTAEKEIQHLILDLRSPQAQAEFSIASQILSRFRPPNELLFKIRRPGDDRPSLFISQATDESWSKNLIILVDRETGNVGEIIAAVLKRESKCLIIGEKTPGLTVEYRDVPVGEDRILRYAIAEVVLEDGTSIFQKGIIPDLQTVTPVEVKKAVFRENQKGTELSEILFQKQRPRMNEAALVAGTDPEIDYYLLRSQNKKTQWDKAPLRDRSLMQALDLLLTSEFLEKGAK
ncbi:S41 family peptidase [Verrucomicrobiales bacterium BCK34]|nr:S41 family peptidase [Verrucomicrobiales bacterium BCK34]